MQAKTKRNRLCFLFHPNKTNSMTLQNLKTQSIKLLKTDKETARVYSFLVDKVQKVAKLSKREPNDTDIVTAAKSCLKQSKESKKAGMDVGHEMVIFESFLPKQVDNADVEGYITNNFGNTSSMKDIMQGVKKEFGNTADMKAASAFVKKYLA
jgi:uncharacterized protein YqeY